VVPGTPAREDQQLGEFFAGCMDDMSHTWADLISEILSMCVFGWSYFEICYKLRQGPGDDPTRRSQFTDGKIGLRKVEIRSQESWDDWKWDDEGGIQGMYQRPPEDYARRFIPIQKALLFRPRTTKNNPEGRSLLRNAVVDYFYSKQLQKIEAIGAERDLAGLPVLQVPARLMQPTVSAVDYALVTELKKADVRAQAR
jgi:hypothetical protein